MSSSFNDPNLNPYDPTSIDYTPETKPMDEIIKLMIQTAAMKFRVHLPGAIVAVKGNQKVDVQPLLQTRYMDGTVVDLPVIQNVMVGMPMGQDYSVKLPIAVGDTGHLIFCDRSLDIWSSGSGGVVDPLDSRLHDISDPVFIPGLVPFSKQTTDTTTDMVLTNGQAQFRIQKGGGFKVQNLTASQELIANLLTLVNTLITASTVAGGPFTPSVVTQLQTVLTNLQTLEGV